MHQKVAEILLGILQRRERRRRKVHLDQEMYTPASWHAAGGRCIHLGCGDLARRGSQVVQIEGNVKRRSAMGEPASRQQIYTAGRDVTCRV
jgi:hypothetical protein